MNHPTTRGLIVAAALLGGAATVYGDEGMWLFNNPPRKQLKEKYGFEPSAEWLDHVRLSSIRFSSGGSGSFVSADGLVMTNHHVAAGDIAKLSDSKHNYMADGFLARTRADELKCKGLELNVLQSIEVVTDRVNAAVKEGATPEEAAAARRAAISTIEKESTEATKLRSDVVTLYGGGQYHLYRYKKYTDVRLVFAPEKNTAFFGGDPDNFEYPRYDLDVTFVRAYENEQPAKVEHYLKWSAGGAKEGELTFVAGHPGRTNRQNTVAELEYLRDIGYPFVLRRLNRLEVLMSVYSGRSPENARRAEDDLFGVQNSRKARNGGLAGLLDPALFARKVAEEKKLRDACAADPSLADALKAFDTVAAATKRHAELIQQYTLLEGGLAFNSAHFGIARPLARWADERGKNDAQRLREFTDARRPSLELQLFSDEPVYDDFEQVKLADGLTFLCEMRGVGDPLVQKILAGKSPRDRAFELISGTKVKSVEERKRLWAAEPSAVAASADPMVALARLVDEESRRLRKAFETEVEEVKQRAHGQIATARYKVFGDQNYPDATFTLRLAFGEVKGYVEDGKSVAPFTNYEGLYARSKEYANKYPFELPQRWFDRKGKLDLKTPLNLVTTADIIGGNSGSPVINKNAEVVGLIFDGNIQSLVLDVIYDDTQGRALSVDSRGIMEALRSVYDAAALADELAGKPPTPAAGN